MTDEPISDNAEEEASENNTPQSDTPESATAPLNRAQRRAQAKGKAGGTGNNPLSPQQNAMRGVGNRGSGHPGQVRFPRTGNK